VSVSDDERLLTPAEVAAAFAVDRETITRWAKQGKLPHIKALGGHRRFRWSDVSPQLQFPE
jgi:excisionase family DNA binding protein